MSIIPLLDPLDLLQDVYYDKNLVQSVCAAEFMAPQTTLTVENTPQITIQWHP